MWTAFFFLGIHAPFAMDIVNIIIFVLTLAFWITMLVMGASSNKLKRESDFWKEQIAVRRAKIAEE